MSVEPKHAAACILWRNESSPEVLLAKRNPELRFMGGQYVFPGGRIHDDESTAHVTSRDDPRRAAAVHGVVREVFEETGILCVQGKLPGAAPLRDARRRLLADEVTLDDILAERRLSIAADEFEDAGYWVTPKFSNIRFATQYFLHRVRDDQQAELIEGEIVGLEWMTPAEARRRWHRGEIRIPTPVAYSLQLLAGGTIPQARKWLARGTERAPGEHNRFEIRRGITLVPVASRTIPPATHTNCVIVGERSLWVIDPGAHDDRERDHLARQLEHLMELGGRVEAVVLSHSHPDHVDGAEFIRDRFDAPIWAHRATDEQVGFDVDRHIADGDVLARDDEHDWRLRAIHTPGHDPGHLCFLEESTGTLLAGDMVANPGTIVVSQQYGGDMAEFMQSLERLLKIECRLMIPSHGRPHGKPHELLREQLEHRRWREQKVKDAYELGATTMDALLAAVYDDVPAAALRLARHSLAAHVAKLGLTVDD